MSVRYTQIDAKAIHHFMHGHLYLMQNYMIRSNNKDRVIVTPPILWIVGILCLAMQPRFASRRQTEQQQMMPSYASRLRRLPLDVLLPPAVNHR